MAAPVDRNLSNYSRGAVFTTREGIQVIIPPSGFDWRSVSPPSVVDPFSESVSQLYPLGTKLTYGEETYRYCKMGATAGLVSNLYQAVVPLAGHINEVIGAPAVGVTTIDFTPAVATTDDLAADELQDGWIIIYDDTGEGHKYRIKSHPAIVGAVLGVLTLVDPIRVAPAAAATATVIHNRYRNVIVHPSPPTAVPVGWPQQAVTANYYFWILTKGPTGMLIDGTVTLGKQVRPSEDDNGAVAALTYDETTSSSNSDYGPVGWVMDIGADAAGAQATFGFGVANLD